MNTKAIIISLVFLLIIIAGSAVGVFLVRQQQTVESEAVVDSGGIATMSLSPSTNTVNINENFPVDINIDVEGNAPITSIQAEITYDFTGDTPAISVTDVEANPNLISANWRYNLLNSRIEGQKVYIEVIANNFDINGFSPTGTTRLATINFKANSDGEIKPRIIHTNSEVLSQTTAQDILSIPADPAGTYTAGTGIPQPTDPSPTVPQVSTTVSPAPTAPQTSPNPTSPANNVTTPPSPTQSSNNNNDGPTRRAIQVTNISDGDILTDTTPTFIGVATDDSRIVASIDSNSITGNTTADTNGNWQWTPSSALSGGGHTATFTATDPYNETSSTSVTFTISTTASDTTLPEAGNSTATLLLISMGMLFILSGAGFILIKR